MRSAIIGILGSALLLGCTMPKEGVATVGDSLPPIEDGVIIARIVGPHRPTPSTSISSGPNTISNFWVTLEVKEVREGFASELMGKTIRLPTCAFDAALVGQTLPLRISRSPGHFQDSDYWLACTSIQISHWIAGAATIR